MKLIYHNTDHDNQYSPFDSELVTLANGQNLCLISPYIGLSYLKRLVKISKSWRLITDFEAWIISHPNENQRLEICDFIIENFDRIKHLGDIHAKVLVTDNSAFLGSANFTDNGILVRTEMSVSFSEQDKVEELKNWFKSLWTKATDFTQKQLYDFVNQNKNVIPQPKIKRLKNPQLKRKRKSTLVPLDTFLMTNRDYETELIKAIRKTKKDKKSLNKYFDLIRKILTDLNISEQSPKITMSVTKDLKMPIIIGQRYIVCPRPRKDAIGLILPLDFKDIISDYPTAVIYEDYFYDKKRNQEALWIEFDSDVIFSDDFLYTLWKKAAKTELDRTMYSGFRRTHNPFYYKAAMDYNYRQTILE
ncbi:MAG TPA: phospholipase D-like domain-containing protein [Burkholderiaceae bacterium]|nr:phospholipase D-like domain-containing protein [Burkholderiaceae bacterium]